MQNTQKLPGYQTSKAEQKNNQKKPFLLKENNTNIVSQDKKLPTTKDDNLNSSANHSKKTIKEMIVDNLLKTKEILKSAITSIKEKVLKVKEKVLKVKEKVLQSEIISKINETSLVKKIKANYKSFFVGLLTLLAQLVFMLTLVIGLFLLAIELKHQYDFFYDSYFF